MAEREDKRIRRTKKLDGQTFLYECGDLLGESERFPQGPRATIADIDLDRIGAERRRMNTFDDNRRLHAERISEYAGGPEALQQVLSRAVDYLEENREIVIVLVQGSGGKGLSQKLIGVLEEYRLDVIQYRSVEDGYVSRFLATGVVGMLEKWITEPQPIPKNEMITLMSKIIAPLLPRTGQ